MTEYCFYMLTIEDRESATVRLAPWTFPNRQGHTTWAQFFANIYVLPFLAHYFLTWALPLGPMVMALCFPFFVWTVEIVEGYALIACFGRNPAWHYYGSDAFLQGTIKLSYFPFWASAGFMLGLALPPFASHLL